MNKENNKTSEPHKFFLNSSQKLDLGSSNKQVTLQNLTFYYAWKIYENSIETINWK